MTFFKVLIRPLEPFSFLHILKTVCLSIRIMLDNRFYLPDLWSIDIGSVSTQKDIYLSLSVLVFEIVVKVSLNGGEKFETRFSGFLYFLFMG